MGGSNLRQHNINSHYLHPITPLLTISCFKQPSSSTPLQTARIILRPRTRRNRQYRTRHNNIRIGDPIRLRDITDTHARCRSNGPQRIAFLDRECASGDCCGGGCGV